MENRDAIAEAEALKPRIAALHARRRRTVDLSLQPTLDALWAEYRYWVQQVDEAERERLGAMVDDELDLLESKIDILLDLGEGGAEQLEQTVSRYELLLRQSETLES